MQTRTELPDVIRCMENNPISYYSGYEKEIPKFFGDSDIGLKTSGAILKHKDIDDPSSDVEKLSWSILSSFITIGKRTQSEEVIGSLADLADSWPVGDEYAFGIRNITHNIAEISMYCRRQIMNSWPTLEEGAKIVQKVIDVGNTFIKYEKGVESFIDYLCDSICYSKYGGGGIEIWIEKAEALNNEGIKGFLDRFEGTDKRDLLSLIVATVENCYYDEKCVDKMLEAFNQDEISDLRKIYSKSSHEYIFRAIVQTYSEWFSYDKETMAKVGNLLQRDTVKRVVVLYDEESRKLVGKETDYKTSKLLGYQDALFALVYIAMKIGKAGLIDGFAGYVKNHYDAKKISYIRDCAKNRNAGDIKKVIGMK